MRHRPFLGSPARLAVLVTALVALIAAGCEPPGDAESDPPLTVPRDRLAAAMSCPASFDSPRQPVLLVHGTAVTPEANWGWNYARALPLAGYDVCTVRLPQRALGDIQVASEYVVFAIRRIHARSERRVDVLGHSQGGLEPRWALRWWPSLRKKVDDVVTMASPHHGTVVADAAAANGCPAACLQMRRAARFIAALNSFDETPGGVAYTALYSLTDELVQPAAPEPTAALRGARNILVQDLCPGRPVDHVAFAFDAVVHAMVIDAFNHPGPADPARFSLATCAQGAFPGVVTGDALLEGIEALSDMLGFPEAPFMTEEPPLAPYAR